MVRTLLGVVASGLVAWSLRPNPPTRPADVRRAFGLLAFGLIGWRVLDVLALSTRGGSLVFVVPRVALALAMWAGTMTLVFCDLPARARWTRAITLWIGVLIVSQGAAGVGAGIAAAGLAPRS